MGNMTQREALEPYQITFYGARLKCGRCCMCKVCKGMVMLHLPLRSPCVMGKARSLPRSTNMG